jgi:kumamolisin
VRSRLWIAAAAAALAGAALTTGGGEARDSAVRALGPTPPRTSIAFALSLRLDQRLLARDLAAGRPPEPSASALGERYGLPLTDVRSVARALRDQGIDVTAIYPQRTEIAARGSVRAIGRFFRVRYRDYVDPAGRSFHAPTVAPTIPRDLRPYVTGVVGLSTRPVALPADLPHGTLRPDDALQAYDVAALRQKGIDGAGLTIAILSLEHFPPEVKETRDDVSTFRSTIHASGPMPADVKVDGGGTVSDTSEDNLDLDVVSAIAPGAQIVNYEAPSTASGEVDIFSKLVADGKVSIATFSWGICDKGLTPAFRQAVESSLKLAVRRGITIFVASGDSGSYDCQRSDFSDHSLSVDFPADLPQVVAVGGTLLSVATDGSYFAEAGWEDPLSNAGGGGGVNGHDPAPSWQSGLSLGGGHRVLPDVSASASPASGWLVRDGGSWSSYGGTSAAAPFWAASMLLAEQYVRQQGVARRCFLAPILYRLASGKQPFAPFHDVRLGGDRYYDAGPGWDYATGLGSPDVYNVARDLAVYVRAYGCGPDS